MQLTNLHVENFKAIALVNLDNLGPFVLIAGPNGVGKSCIFDAIRILKSHHGGYSPNEIDHLYGEFQLDAREPSKLRPLFRDPTKPIIIQGTFSISEAERAYLRSNLRQVLSDHVWRDVIGRQTGDNQAMYQQRMLIATTNQGMVEHVNVQAAALYEQLVGSLEQPEWTANLRVDLGSIPVKDGDLLLQILFAHYAPEHIGIIDYHSASRTYVRESVGAFNVSFADIVPNGEQSLYNTGGKYQNIKAEMVSAYIRELIRKEWGQSGASSQDGQSSLADSLKDLFDSFFPGKSFNGLQVNQDGVPEFPVTVQGGHHDLNELSSGEKEIVFGYLRLRTATPRNSIILLDEPELHLNPALLVNLPPFYNKHIGKERGNQLILVTHSDAILRPVVGSEDYMLVHLGPPGEDSSANQASVVKGHDEFERTLISLAGDVATYKPNAKYLILEGGDNTGIDSSGFDRRLISALFPDFARRVNILGGGDRSKVERLIDLLEDPGLKAEFGHRIFAIVDHDSFDSEVSTVIRGNYFIWDRYHIENYLLYSDDIVASVVATVTGNSCSSETVVAKLKKAANELVENLAFQATRKEINSEFVNCIKLGKNVGKNEPVDLLSTVFESSYRRVVDLASGMSKEVIEQKYSSHNARYQAALSNDDWRKIFPGREIIKRFVENELGSNMSYEFFVNSIISAMASQSVQPPGMVEHLRKIDPASFLSNPTQAV